jgi:EmrB/QacA subfamily drug resistance transporter
LSISTLVNTNQDSPALPARAINKWLILVVVCLAQFVVVLDATIVNVALPSIQHGLHFTLDSLQWVVNAYTLTFGGFLLLGGRVADLLGRRRLFIAGLIAFSLASLIDGLAQNGGMLIAARALQGVGAAFLSPAALSLLTTNFPGSGERTRALGVWSAISAGGGAAGLLAGGILTTALSWQWIFFVNVPIGALAVLAAVRYIPESVADLGHRQFDVAGALSVTSGLVLLVFTLVKAQSFGWTSLTTIGLFAISAVLLAGFVLIESRSTAPLIRLNIFTVRSLAVGDLILLLVGAGLFSMFFFTSVYAQEVLGYSALRAGFAFFPVAIAIGVGAGISQALIPRLGVRGTIIMGLGLGIMGMALMTRLPVDGTYPDLLEGLMPISIGLGLTFAPATLLGTSGVEGQDAGLASGLLNTAQQVGGAIGLAVLSTLAANRTSSALSALHQAPSRAAFLSAEVDGFHVAFAGGALLFVAGLMAAVLLLRQSHLAHMTVPSPIAEAA